MSYKTFVVEEIGKALRSIDHEIYIGKHDIFIIVRGQNIYPKKVRRYILNLNDCRLNGLYHSLHTIIVDLITEGFRFN